MAESMTTAGKPSAAQVKRNRGLDCCPQALVCRARGSGCQKRTPRTQDK